jgi:hypothetical protein
VQLIIGHLNAETVGTQLLEWTLDVERTALKSRMQNEVHCVGFAHELLSVGRLGRNDFQMGSELRDRSGHDVAWPSFPQFIDRAPSPLGEAVHALHDCDSVNPHSQQHELVPRMKLFPRGSRQILIVSMDMGAVNSSTVCLWK